MSNFEEMSEELRAAQRKYQTAYEDDFHCKLLNYFMNLDYKALMLDAIKDGYHSYQLVHHPNLSYLSDEQKILCLKMIFKTLKQQHLLDENLGFRDWHTASCSLETAAAFVQTNTTSWLMVINALYQLKNHDGHCVSGAGFVKALPPGDYFIESDYESYSESDSDYESDSY